MPEFADKAFMESYSEYIKNNFVSSGGGEFRLMSTAMWNRC